MGVLKWPAPTAFIDSARLRSLIPIRLDQLGKRGYKRSLKIVDIALADVEVGAALVRTRKILRGVDVAIQVAGR